MTQYTIHSAYASVIALDVHARTVTAKGIDLATGETKAKRFNNCPIPEEIVSWVEKHFPSPHYAAYESGCTGFNLAHKLTELGITCDVIAVSTIARSSDDKQRKSDRKDAKRLLQELLIPKSSLSRVWLPDKECEGVRDFLRCYQDAVDARKRLKQQTLALLLRHGFVWNEKTPRGKTKPAWKGPFMKWINSLDLGSSYANAAFSSHLFAITEKDEQIKRMRIQIEDLAQQPRWKPYVDAFICIEGVASYAALVYAAEFGDFSRFKNGRSVSRYVGVTPKSHASGDKKENNGAITKAGNGHLRLVAVEGCTSLPMRKMKPIKLNPDQVVSEKVLTLCRTCNRRLSEKYCRLTQVSKKPSNVAKIAAVSEMVRWIWVIGCTVQEEQQNKAMTA